MVPVLMIFLIAILVFGALVFRKIENDELSVALVDCFRNASELNKTGKKLDIFWQILKLSHEHKHRLTENSKFVIRLKNRVIFFEESSVLDTIVGEKKIFFNTRRVCQ